VGRVLPNLDVKIAEDGEILVKGPSVFSGYWNMPEETKNAFDGEWFKTGDVGTIDPDGFLIITDRKKDLIKTSGGKFIAPQPIENSLKANPLVSEAAVIGERRRFPCVVIAPSLPVLHDWAREYEIAYDSDADLVANPKVQALYEAIVHHVNNNLAQFEKLKKVLVLPEELSVSNGTLTPTLKLRRRKVEEHYREMIEKLYADGVPEKVRS
jgi:long-chain acyl-CoA synthetase